MNERSPHNGHTVAAFKFHPGSEKASSASSSASRKPRLKNRGTMALAVDSEAKRSREMVYPRRAGKAAWDDKGILVYARME